MSNTCCGKVVTEILEMLDAKALDFRVSAMLCVSSENERTRMRMAQTFSDMSDKIRRKYLEDSNEEKASAGSPSESGTVSEGPPTS